MPHSDKGGTGLLWLIGMMGAGKSAVGRALASKHDMVFIDIDCEVASRAGCSVAELWDDLGEAAFRDLEAEAVERTAAMADEGIDAVVATGGGAILNARSREVMQSSGYVVWLTATPQALAARVGEGRGRPLLGEHEPPADILQKLLDERRPMYESTADVVVATDAMTIEAVVEQIEALWKTS